MRDLLAAGGETTAATVADISPLPSLGLLGDDLGTLNPNKIHRRQDADEPAAQVVVVGGCGRACCCTGGGGKLLFGLYVYTGVESMPVAGIHLLFIIYRVCFF